jgi:UDP-glucose 4,6-dehydratase
VGQVYNIGTKKERRVIDVAKDICNLFNLDYKKSIKMVDNRPFNDQCYILDDKKLIALGWQERTSWVDGLQKTKDWYIANPS